MERARAALHQRLVRAPVASVAAFALVHAPEEEAVPRKRSLFGDQGNAVGCGHAQKERLGKVLGVRILGSLAMERARAALHQRLVRAPVASVAAFALVHAPEEEAVPRKRGQPRRRFYRFGGRKGGDNTW